MNNSLKLAHFGSLTALVALVWGLWCVAVVLGLAAWGGEGVSVELVLLIFVMWFWPVGAVAIVGLFTQWAMIRYKKPALARIFYGFVALLIAGLFISGFVFTFW
jgi:hypothetical protein